MSEISNNQMDLPLGRATSPGSETDLWFYCTYTDHIHSCILSKPSMLLTSHGYTREQSTYTYLSDNTVVEQDKPPPAFSIGTSAQPPLS